MCSKVERNVVKEEYERGWQPERATRYLDPEGVGNVVPRNVDINLDHYTVL